MLVDRIKKAVFVSKLESFYAKLPTLTSVLSATHSSHIVSSVN